MHTNVTETGKATDQPLTEGAHAHGNAEGKTRHCVHSDRIATLEEKLAVRDQCPNWGTQCYHNYYVDAYHLANRRVYVATTEEWDDVAKWEQRRDKAWERLVQSQLAHDHYAEQRQKAIAHQRNKDKLHKGAWAFTLTYSPAKHGWDKEEAKAAMTTAIQRLQHYYRNEIVEFEAVGEWTQAGLPHVHGHYRLEAGKRITTKNFKRAYPIWNPNVRIGKGHEGGYHEPAKSDSDYSGYIQKDLDDSWLRVGTTSDARHNQANVPEAEDIQIPTHHTSSDPPSDSE